VIEEYPTYGLDMIGKIKNEDTHFYLKDHLGSIRVMLDSRRTIVSAQDYDQWGYLLDGRYYQSDNSKFKFTGKQLDEESNYYYFGARYYDARIGRWGQVEPLMEKYLQISPYIYSLNNPIKLIDVDGFDVIVVLSGAGFYKAGQEISPSNYSPSSDIGAERLLYNLQSFSDNNNIEDLDIKGYYSSIGIGEKNEIVDAANFIINNLNNVDEKVILYGYSQGGANIVELANYLNEQGVNVNALFTVDAYEGLSESSGFIIPENTKDNFNYFQISPDALTGARGSVNEGVSSKTRVRNIIKKNSSHRSIDEDTSSDILRIIYNRIE
jgi:RHS repeat-associated protein